VFYFTNFGVSRVIYWGVWERVKKHLRGDIDCFVSEVLSPTTVLVCYTCLGGALWRDETCSDQVQEQKFKELYIQLYKKWKHLETLKLDPSDGSSTFPKTVTTYADAALQNVRAAFILYATTARAERTTRKRCADDTPIGPDPKRRELDALPPLRQYRRAAVQEFFEGRYKRCKDKQEELEGKLKCSRQSDLALEELKALTKGLF